MLPGVRGLRDWLPKGHLLDERVWSSRHRAITIILWAHVVGVPLFAVVRGFGVLHPLVEASPLLGAAMVATWGGHDRRVRSIAATFGLMSSSAVLVHLSGGVIEMHFHFFVMVPIVILYQDWVPFFMAILYVLVHHGLMGALYPESVYNHGAAVESPWKWAAIHALFVGAESAVCVVAWRMNERSRLETEQVRRRMTVLAEASRVLVSSLDVDRVLGDLAGIVVPAVADACYVDLLDGSHLRRVAARSSDGWRHSALDVPDGRDQDHVITRVLRGGVSESIAVDGHVASVAAIVVRGETLGALTVVAPRAGAASEEDLHDTTLVLELARRVAGVVENARLYARERGVAETLQRSLLPEGFPTIPGLEVAARYAPGGPGVEVGGDWYDLFELPNGNVAIVMGDVVGRGVPAASLMGQLRNALRAYAGEGHPPATVLAKLHRLVHVHDPDHLATLAYGELDPASGLLRLASAGHPAPLIADRNGEVRVLEDSGGVPLGAIPHPTFFETTTHLPVGARLVLFTDGLVEDRDLTLEAGTERVRQAVAAGPTDLEPFCDHVLSAATTDRAVDDDVALLVVRLQPLPEPFAFDMPSEPRSLLTIRAALRRWLTLMDAGEDEIYEILVAAGEACANAIEHATGPATGRFTIEGSREGNQVCIAVRDAGSWRPYRPGPGGRGLHVMESFMDRVDIERTDDGTEVKLIRNLHSVPALQ